MPRPTIRTAREMSAAPQSLGMKPEAPAAFAAPGEIRPAPEISRMLRVGRALAQLRADLGPRLLADEQVDERDVRLVARGQRVGLGRERELMQRSTQGWLPSIRRKPQCTTS
jgi:hypothetical protein